MEGELVCKYVMKGEESIGESIDVHNDQLIVKAGSDFLGVSVNNIEKVESDKIYVSDFDQKKAEDVGKKWIDEKSKPVSMEELKMFGFEEPNEGDEEGEVEEGNTEPETESVSESEIGSEPEFGAEEGTEADEVTESGDKDKSEEQKN